MKKLITIVAFAAMAATATATANAQQTLTRLLRQPDIHGDRVAFVYAGDIWIAPAAGGEARRLTSDDGMEYFPKFSPDGRWIAYVSDESGQDEVYVRPFPPRPGKWKVSVSGNRGTQPRWRRDGKELFYMESVGGAGHRWMSVPVRPGLGGGFEIGASTQLFALPTTFTTAIQYNDFVYSPSPDGQRLLLNTSVVNADTALLNVIVNWQKAAAPPAREP